MECRTEPRHVMAKTLSLWSGAWEPGLKAMFSPSLFLCGLRDKSGFIF